MSSRRFVAQLTGHLGPLVLDDGCAKASLFGAFFLVLFAVVVFATMNFGHPIECWSPQHYSVEGSQYAEKLCLRGNTYFRPVVGDGPNRMLKFPFTEEDKRANSTDFYGHMSIMFAICAGLSLAPKLVFQLLLKTVRVPLKRLATETLEAQKATTEMRAENVKTMADQFYEEIVTRKKTFGCWNIRTVILFSKALYLFSTLLQFWVLSSFLRLKHDLLWGWTLTYDILIGKTWKETGIFPKTVFCDVEKAIDVGDWRFDEIQCHLGVNNINEPLCMFLWWWYCILAVVSLIGFLMELMNCNTIGSLKKLMLRPSTMRRKKGLQEFAEFLTPDGVIVLRFLRRISDVVTDEVAVKLLEKYESDRQDRYVEEGISFLMGYSEVPLVAVDETSL